MSLAGLRANVVKGKDGKFNFDDLIEAKPGGETRAEAEPGKQVGFDISGVRIEHANVTYRDAASGQELAIADFNLHTGRIANDVPGKLEFSASAKGKNPALDAQVKLSAGYVFNLERKSFALSGLDAKLAGTAFGMSGLDLVAKGDFASDPARGELSASGLEVKAKRGTGQGRFRGQNHGAQACDRKRQSERLGGDGGTDAQGDAAGQCALQALGRRGLGQIAQHCGCRSISTPPPRATAPRERCLRR